VALQWVLPLASVPSVIGQMSRVVGHCVGTMNLGSRALFYMALCERGPLPQEW
jgi:hypothetical protein